MLSGIRLNFFMLFILFLVNDISAQKINKTEKDSLRIVLDKMKEQDQRYRWQVMLAETDENKLDSLKNKISFENRMKRLNDVAAGKIKLDSGINRLLRKEIERLDSLNFIKFYQITKKYGYPSYKRTGSTAVDVLTIHFVDSVHFSLLFSLFENELKKGNMNSVDYAQWYDRSMLHVGKKQLYGEYNKEYPCVENIEQTNIARKKIGLKKIKTNNCR